jgi:hypothetical protein
VAKDVSVPHSAPRDPVFSRRPNQHLHSHPSGPANSDANESAPELAFAAVSLSTVILDPVAPHVKVIQV